MALDILSLHGVTLKHHLQRCIPDQLTIIVGRGARRRCIVRTTSIQALYPVVLIDLVQHQSMYIQVMSLMVAVESISLWPQEVAEVIIIIIHKDNTKTHPKAFPTVETKPTVAPKTWCNLARNQSGSQPKTHQITCKLPPPQRWHISQVRNSYRNLIQITCPQLPHQMRYTR